MDNTGPLGEGARTGRGEGRCQKGEISSPQRFPRGIRKKQLLSLEERERLAHDELKAIQEARKHL